MAADFYVYVLFRPWDGRPCYIGKGRQGRWTTHQTAGAKHRNKHLANIFLRNHGKPIPKVKIRTGLTEPQAVEIEIALISAVGRADKRLGPLANKTDGGEGLSNPSSETREKKAKALRGKPRPLDVRARISASLKGHAMSAETKEKIGTKSKLMWADPEIRTKVVKSQRGIPRPRIKRSDIQPPR